MSDYMFGIIRGRKPSDERIREMNRICREEGGYGFIWYRDPNGSSYGWFTGPNFGNPFDKDLRDRVLKRLELLDE